MSADQTIIAIHLIAQSGILALHRRLVESTVSGWNQPFPHHGIAYRSVLLQPWRSFSVDLINNICDNAPLPRSPRLKRSRTDAARLIPLRIGSYSLRSIPRHCLC